MRKVLSLPYRIYRKVVFPKINSVKGSHRLLVILKRIALLGLNKAPSGLNWDELDWKNLIILDACRHDLYEEVFGETDYIYSKGSNTTQFIKKNFQNKDFSDTIYITANPHFNSEKFEELTGNRLHEVFHEVFHTYDSRWDNEENTVLPSSVIEDVKTAEKLFPNKRKIIHFMQPHYPFIGANLTSQGIRQDLDHSKEDLNVWQMAEKGKYDDQELWNAYKKNLEIVKAPVSELRDCLKGKTVVTSDHGNLVGENGLYGHTPGFQIEELRKVPWDVINYE